MTLAPRLKIKPFNKATINISDVGKFFEDMLRTLLVFSQK